jgi:Nucleotide-diphospho-sugar transferase
LTTSSDEFLGDPDNIHNFPNTGFIYVKSTNKTIEMMNYWLDARERFPANHEQNIFNFIKTDLVDMLRVKVRYIDTEYCGGFCNHGNDLNKICTMHANCCVGLYAKLHDLRKIIEDWKLYMAMPVEERKRGGFKWRVRGLCMH